MHEKRYGEYIWSMAACATVADTAHRRWGRRLQSKINERAVQLPTDLVEQLLARDQLVCADDPHHRDMSIDGTTSTTMQTGVHARRYRNTVPSATFSSVYLENKK